MRWPWRRTREEQDTGLIEYVEVQGDRIARRAQIIQRNAEEILRSVHLIEAEIKTMAREE